jgi:hypothetical protein
MIISMKIEFKPGEIVGKPGITPIAGQTEYVRMSLDEWNRLRNEFDFEPMTEEEFKSLQNEEGWIKL